MCIISACIVGYTLFQEVSTSSSFSSAGVKLGLNNFVFRLAPSRGKLKIDRSPSFIFCTGHVDTPNTNNGPPLPARTSTEYHNLPCIKFVAVTVDNIITYHPPRTFDVSNIRDTLDNGNNF